MCGVWNMVPGPCSVPIPFFRLLLKKAVHGPEEESWIHFLSLVNQPSKSHSPPPARNPRFRWQVTMSGARASDSSDSSDDGDEEEELAQEFEKFCLADKRAAIAAGRAAALERFNKKIEAKYKEAGKRMEEEMEIRARLRQFGVRMQNLPHGWKRAIRGEGEAQEKRARFMNQRVEEQMLKRAERFEAEQVLNAHCPGAVMRYQRGVSAILSREAEEKEERETTVHKRNGARRAAFISIVLHEDGNDDGDDSDEEEEPEPAGPKRSIASIIDGVDSDDSDDDQAP